MAILFRFDLYSTCVRCNIGLFEHKIIEPMLDYCCILISSLQNYYRNRLLCSNLMEVNKCIILNVPAGELSAHYPSQVLGYNIPGHWANMYLELHVCSWPSSKMLP